MSVTNLTHSGKRGRISSSSVMITEWTRNNNVLFTQWANLAHNQYLWREMALPETRSWWHWFSSYSFLHRTIRSWWIFSIFFSEWSFCKHLSMINQLVRRPVFFSISFRIWFVLFHFLWSRASQTGFSYLLMNIFLYNRLLPFFITYTCSYICNKHSTLIKFLSL